MFARSITIKVNFLVNTKNLIKVSSGINKLRSGMRRFGQAARGYLGSIVRGFKQASVVIGQFGRSAWRVLSNTEAQMERLRASVDGLVNAFRKSFIIVMSLYAIGRGLGSFIAAAGAIEENLNAMSISFERNKDAVLDWADGYAKATGRSRYEIREMSTQFALIMKGQIDDSDTVAKLSMGLTERAVDMQSALQEAAGSSADVSRAIISALTGETEQIKRWGVDVRVDALKRFAKEMGKNYANMSEAEKIEIRYQKLLRDTNYLVGDAIRTKEEYTNTIKNFFGVAEDFRRVIGMGILKPILKLTNLFADNIRKLNEWLEVGSRVQAMFGTIGVVLVAALTKAAVVFAPLLIKLALLSTLVTVVWIILEDFFAWLNNEDRKTTFGKFADEINLTRGEVKEFASAMWDLARATAVMVGWLAKLMILVGRTAGEEYAKAIMGDNMNRGRADLRKKLLADMAHKRATGGISYNDRRQSEKVLDKIGWKIGEGRVQGEKDLQARIDYTNKTIVNINKAANDEIITQEVFNALQENGATEYLPGVTPTIMSSGYGQAPTGGALELAGEE